MSTAQQPHHVWWSLFELEPINHCSVRLGSEIIADSRECEEQKEGRAGFLRPIDSPVKSCISDSAAK